MLLACMSHGSLGTRHYQHLTIPAALLPLPCCLATAANATASTRQGGWEDDESLEAAARRETVEEAGVRGSIEVSQQLQESVCCAELQWCLLWFPGTAWGGRGGRGIGS